MAALTERAPWPELREELRIETAGSNHDGSPAWHILDPVRNVFFRIGWLELECLRRWPMADPARIAEEVARQTTLNPEAEDVERLADYLGRHQLVRAARPPVKRSAWQWLLSNYLFVRLPLVRPARVLRRLEPCCRFLYRPWWWALSALVGLGGLLLAGRQWDQVLAMLAGAMTSHGVMAFALALVFSKLLHEFGHAMTATRHGVRVGHMGIALLVLWPMPYTDTGESWRLIRARDRLVIASAGIVAELMLAAWATLAWVLAPDGSVRDALFFLATTAWVLTLAINVSPFMRFDGYYMLCDAIDFPGLHERANHEALRLVRRWLLGLQDPTAEPLAPGRRAALAAFAVATWLYRLVVFVGIALLVYHVFFKALGLFLFLVEIFVFIFRPVLNECRVWWQRRAEIRAGRLFALSALGLILLVLLALPLPWPVRAPAVLVAGVERPVYVPIAARLVALRIGNGDRVVAGQTLATFDTPAELEQQARADAMAQAWSLAARSALGTDESAARSATAERQARVYRQESRARQAELQRLQLTADAPGVVRDVDPLLAPGTWVGTRNAIAVVIDGRRWRADVMVDERDRARLRAGGKARVFVTGSGRRLNGTVVAIEDTPTRQLPHALLARPHGGEIALDVTAASSELRPADSWFKVTVGGEAGEALTGVRAARVHLQASREPLGVRWGDALLAALVRQAGL